MGRGNLFGRVKARRMEIVEFMVNGRVYDGGEGSLENKDFHDTDGMEEARQGEGYNT